MMGLPHLISALWRGYGAKEDTDMPTDEVFVHPLTQDATKAWEVLSVKQPVSEVKPISVKTPINPRKVRFVCVSDTHNRMPLRTEIPDGDVLLHAGDFSMVGRIEEIESFNSWLGSLPHKHKIVIAGNHDLTFDDTMMANPSSVRCFGLSVDEEKKKLAERGVTHARELLTNCIYLQDSEISVYGIRIYGSPWQPWFYDWGFNLERGQPCLDKWNLIPEDVDVLLTHGPPIGHGDLCKSGHRAGCVELLQTIQKRVKCKYHVFGHIHEGYGITTDGNTTYINASTCTLNYRATNTPIIFDLPLPEGVSKEDSNPSSTESENASATGGTEQVEEMEVEEKEDKKDGEEKKDDKGPLVLNEVYHLDPTPAPHSSTSTDYKLNH